MPLYFIRTKVPSRDFISSNSTMQLSISIVATVSMMSTITVRIGFNFVESLPNICFGHDRCICSMFGLHESNGFMTIFHKVFCLIEVKEKIQ